jgi:bifunctional oligoribonuclease and PAP phosphatase NrnA
MTDLDRDLALAAGKIAAAKKVLVTCHLGPDGDSVGSMVALTALLRARGVEVTLLSQDLIPRNLKWLPLARTAIQRLKKNARFELTVVVDCGDPKLLGKEFPPPEVTGEIVVLDHHASGRPFGDLFVCDPAASSVGVMVARIARHLGWELGREAALGIYVSLVTDTGSFRYANTNAEALRLAADLVEGCGVDPWRISERLGERGSLARYRLLAAALSTLETTQEGRLAFMTVTQEMVDSAGAAWDDTDGLVNYTRAIRGVECGILITPAKRGGVRVSLRSKGRLIDAGAVCLPLGGGGHTGAAGCTLPCDDLAAVRKTVEEALAAALAGSSS